MPTTNFKNSSGTDIGNTLVEKSYLFDRYPELADTFKQAGLWAWGQNYVGQLADNTVTDRSSPVQTVAGGTNWKEIKGGGRRSAYGIKTDGTLWAWGYNGGGQLGTGDAGYANKSSPTQVGSATTWKTISRGGVHGAAIKTDGTLWCWGYNYNGEVGVAATSQLNPTQTVAAGTNWKFVSAGTYFTTAVKTDGTLWTWGSNNYGQLGDGTRDNKSSPVQISGTNWKFTSGGGYHTAAIKTDGTLWLWGEAAQGKLGDNTTANKSSPVQTVAGGTNWKMISVSGHSMAIKTDGTLWTWGVNNWGQIGDGTTTNKSSPVQIGGTNWKQVDAGGYSSVSSSYAIRDDSADIFGNTL